MYINDSDNIHRGTHVLGSLTVSVLICKKKQVMTQTINN